MSSILAYAPLMANAEDQMRKTDNFYTSDAVNTRTVTFKNQYGMEMTGTLFTPKTMTATDSLAAIVVSHPFRAVRQQAANLYATKLAEAGFVTLTFDQTFWGESVGFPRGGVSPDIYTENISAAVDFLGTRPFVDAGKIGALGICAGGGFTIAAAKVDPRIKAIATSGMYDMGEFFRHGIGNARSNEGLKKVIAAAVSKRYEEYSTGEIFYGDGHSGSLSPEALESQDFYETSRGKVPSNNRQTAMSSYVKFMHFYPFEDMDIISPRPILFIVCTDAPSAQFTYDAYKKASEPKELCEVHNATRLDLYDRINLIPWEKIYIFFEQNLKDHEREHKSS